MIEIRRIERDEWLVAKRVVYRVALDVFNDSRLLDESMAFYEERGELKDMDNIEQSYFENGGIFLVTTENDTVIGTGAIRKLEGGVCELKRLWLLSEYHRKGLGFRMMQELLSFAREQGYQRVRLETDPIYQKRAIEFYKRLGFYEVPILNAHPEEEILIELIL